MWILSVCPEPAANLRAVDVAVRARPGATVRDLAEALARHLAPGRSDVRYVVPVDGGTAWPASRPLAECGLLSGDLLNVAVRDERWAEKRAFEPGAAASHRAVLRVTAGGDAGRVVPLNGDVATVGRDAACTVQIGDPLVSRLHLHLRLTSTGPFVVDNGSASGIVVGDERLAWAAPVTWGTPITFGATTVVLEPGEGARPARRTAIVRPPRFGEPLAGQEIEVPPPPARPRPAPLPWGMLLLPVVIGAGMLGTGWSSYGLILVVAWPLLILLDHWLHRWHAAREFARDLRLWREDLAQVLDTIDDRARAQRERGMADHPPAGDLRGWALGPAAMLWGRHRDSADYLACRLGLGPVTALCTARLSSGGDREALRVAESEVAQRRVLTDMPVLHRLEAGALTAIVGPDEAVDAHARALVMRLCATHSPAEVALAAVLSPGELAHRAAARGSGRTTAGREPSRFGMCGLAPQELLGGRRMLPPRDRWVKVYGYLHIKCHTATYPQIDCQEIRVGEVELFANDVKRANWIGNTFKQADLTTGKASYPCTAGTTYFVKGREIAVRGPDGGLTSSNSPAGLRGYRCLSS